MAIFNVQHKVVSGMRTVERELNICSYKLPAQDNQKRRTLVSFEFVFQFKMKAIFLRPMANIAIYRSILGVAKCTERNDTIVQIYKVVVRILQCWFSLYTKVDTKIFLFEVPHY